MELMTRGSMKKVLMTKAVVAAAMDVALRPSLAVARIGAHRSERLTLRASPHLRTGTRGWLPGQVLCLTELLITSITNARPRSLALVK